VGGLSVLPLDCGQHPTIRTNMLMLRPGMKETVRGHLLLWFLFFSYRCYTHVLVVRQNNKKRVI
jgi:hypothetical protein